MEGAAQLVDLVDRVQLGARGLVDRLKRAIEAVDFMVTTKYHARAVRSALAGSGVPLVTIGIDPALVEAVRRQVNGAGLTVVAATAEFGDRMRLMYCDGVAARSKIRVIVARDTASLRRLDHAVPILLTRAARELLPWLEHVPLVFPHSPTLDTETLDELSRAIVTANHTRHTA